MFSKMLLKCTNILQQANKLSLKMNGHLTVKLSKATLKYIELLEKVILKKMVHKII